MDGWRWTWATTGIVVFVGFFGDATATPHSTLTTVLYFVFAGAGLAVFVIAMASPKWLPGREAAERDEQKREKQRHESEVKLEVRKENVRRNLTGRFPFTHFGNMDQQRLTDSNNYLADEMRLQREARERQSDSSGDDSSSQGST